MPKQNLNENKINQSIQEQGVNSQETKTQVKQGFFKKILNFFKSLGETILNGIEWIKAYEREMISNKRKPGKWIMVNYEITLERKESINIDDIIAEAAKLKQPKQNLSTILEESQSLESSTGIDSQDLSDSQDMKTRVNPKYIQERDKKIQEMGGTEKYLNALDEIREIMKNPPKTQAQQSNHLNKPKQGPQL